MQRDDLGIAPAWESHKYTITLLFDLKQLWILDVESSSLLSIKHYLQQDDINMVDGYSTIHVE